MTGETSTTTNATTTTTTAAQQQQQALTAYLGPLCQKHDKGELITYEDLMASKQAADSVAAKEVESTVRRRRRRIGSCAIQGGQQ